MKCILPWSQLWYCFDSFFSSHISVIMFALETPCLLGNSVVTLCHGKECWLLWGLNASQTILEVSHYWETSYKVVYNLYIVYNYLFITCTIGLQSGCYIHQSKMSYQILSYEIIKKFPVTCNDYIEYFSLQIFLCQDNIVKKTLQDRQEIIQKSSHIITLLKRGLYQQRKPLQKFYNKHWQSEVKMFYTSFPCLWVIFSLSNHEVSMTLIMPKYMYRVSLMWSGVILRVRISQDRIRHCTIVCLLRLCWSFDSPLDPLYLWVNQFRENLI